MGRRPKQDTPKHEAQPMDGMRSMWEFVFISQFLRVFQDKFSFAHFELEDLENAFLESENYPLFSVFASLLRILLRRHDIRMDSWQDILSEEIEKRDENWNPIKDKTTYSEISVENRVLLLQHLIEYVCENDPSPELKEFRTEFLNPDSKEKGPLGQDAQGNIYWYFDGLRLYKEKRNKRGNKKSWETLCSTSEEWETFIKSFEKSKDSNEKKLFQYLQNELSPKLMPLLKEHEKEKELRSKKRKVKSPKSKQKELTKEEEKDALIKQEEEEIEKMKQEEENEKQKNMEIEHRKKGRRKKTEVIEHEDKSPEESTKKNEEQEELEKRVAEELEKQEQLISAEDIESGLVPRTKRRCVIVREQTKNKKEWWDEEGIGSDLDEAEEDADSDSSDGPRRKKKRKIMKPVELPAPTNRTFVFSTELANRAAEAVQQGRVESIITFHRAQRTTSPYVKLDKDRTFDPSNKSYEQQKAYYSQQYRQQSMMPRGYGGMPGSVLPDGSAGPGGRPGYSPAQWQQLQLQQQYLKDRQTHQASNQVVDDLNQIIFGGPSNGNVQPPVGDPSYSRGAYPQRMGMPGQPGVQYGYPQRMPAQQQQPASFQDNRMHDQYRPPFQQNQFPGYTQQQQQQGQFFQRPRQLPHLHSPSAQSPSSDPLGANVRSPPPPYPGNRTSDSRPQQQHHMVNSPAPVPSPTSTGSPQTPLTPHTPHTPRFAGAVPSPGEPTKPPFSPSSQQSPYTGAGIFPGTKRPSSESSGSETANEGQNRPGYIDLGNKTYQSAPPNSHRSQNPYSSYSHTSPMENNQENTLRSPTDIQAQRSMASFDNPSSESPFLTSAGQNMNRSPFSTTAASVSKSFSVESLTAPSQPGGRTGHPQGAEQQMSPYGGIYYQSKYQAPGMFGGQRYPYPSEALYNSPIQSNVYIERGSMPVYPPGRDSHL